MHRVCWLCKKIRDEYYSGEYEDDECDYEDEAIDWCDAYEHIGEEITVVGEVVGSRSGDPTFLNLGCDYPDPDRFQVVIFGDYLYNFPYYPADVYFGENILVTGVVEEYNGVAEMIIESPDNIEII